MSERGTNEKGEPPCPDPQSHADSHSPASQPLGTSGFPSEYLVSEGDEGDEGDEAGAGWVLETVVSARVHRLLLTVVVVQPTERLNVQIQIVVHLPRNRDRRVRQQWTYDYFLASWHVLNPRAHGRPVDVCTTAPPALQWAPRAWEQRWVLPPPP